MPVNDQDIAQQIQYAKAAKTKWLQHGLTCYDDEVDITFALAEGLASVEIRAQMLLVTRQRRKIAQQGKLVEKVNPNAVF